jgi:hypothetical protein
MSGNATYRVLLGFPPISLSQTVEILSQLQGFPPTLANSSMRDATLWKIEAPLALTYKNTS